MSKDLKLGSHERAQAGQESRQDEAQGGLGGAGGGQQLGQKERGDREGMRSGGAFPLS